MERFCPECGNKINGTFQFCPYCGAKLPLNQSSFEQNNNDFFDDFSNTKKNSENNTKRKSSEIETVGQGTFKMNKTTKIVAIIAVTVIMIISISIVFLLIDVDNDELSNLKEIQLGTSLFDSDTDNDLLLDGEENNEYNTNPLKMDSDNDGLDDNAEITIYSSDPLDEDCDDDGLKDGEEVNIGSSLFDDDTDDDGYEDGNDNHPNTHEWKLMDSDDDGWNDYKEYYEKGTNIYSSETDGDGAPDPRDAHPLNAARTITRYYEWGYPRGWYSSITWTWNISLSQDLYLYISDLDRITEHSEWSSYTLDQTVIDLAVGLNDAAEGEGFDYYQTVDFVLAFVQSMQYTSDDVTTGYDEYPRYPIETLVDGGGDCEDTRFLVSGILNQMRYDVCLLSFPGHLAVGVEGDESYPGTYYEYQGKRYYYCETTAEGWTMGEIPEGAEFETANIIPI